MAMLMRSLKYADRGWAERVCKGMTSAEADGEIAARQERIAQIRRRNGGSLDGVTGETAEEVRRLIEEADILKNDVPVDGLPHPRPRGGTGSPASGGDFGRLEGLGRAFLDNLGGGDGTRLMAVLDGTSGGTMVPAFFDPGIRDLPQRSLFVRSLIPTVQASGDKVWFLRQSVATQNAAAVAAGAVKPTSVYTVERIEQKVTTIAHVTEALDRMLLSDYDQLTQFLDNQLRLGVLLAEEGQILNGTGVAPQLLGILQTPGIQTQAKAADTVPDAVFKAITKIRLTNREPNGIVVHPNDWQDIRLLKDTTGQYIVETLGEDGQPRLWGLDVITSPAITEGTGLVGFFGDSQIWDREQARVTFAESGLGDVAGQEMFTRNQVRFRGESRLAFGVIRPTSFCTVTGI